MKRPLLWLALAFTLMSGTLVALSLYFQRAQAIEAGQRLTESYARVIADQTTRTIQTVDQRLQIAARALTDLKAAGTLNEQSARLVLREQAKSVPFVRAMWIMDTQGRIVYDADEGNIGLSLQDRPYFQIYLTEPDVSFHLGAPVRSRSTGTWLVSASRPLKKADGSFDGIIVAAVEPPYFDRLWRTVDLGADGSVALMSRTGVMMMRAPINDDAMGKSFQDRALFKLMLPKSSSGSYEDASGVDGMVRLFSYRTLPELPDFVVVVGQSRDSVLAAWHKFATTIALVWLTSSLGLMLLANWLDRVRLLRARAAVLSEQMAQRLALATETASIGVWEWDIAADRWEATPTYFTLLGDAIGSQFTDMKGWLERVHPDERPSVEGTMRAVLAGKANEFHYEARFRHVNGQYQWMDVIGRALAHDGQGKATRLLGARTDITERKRAEQALRDSEARYREMFESNPHPMWVYDLETLAFLSVNDAAMAHYGYSRDEFLAMTIRDIRPAEDLARLLENVGRVKPPFSTADLWHHLRKDGSVILVEISSHSLKFGDRPARMIHAHDVTARQLAEDKLRLSEENLGITLNSIGDAVIATDATGLITRMNPTAERLTGWPMAEALGQPLTEVFHIISAQTRLPSVNPVQQVMDNGTVVDLANHTALLARDGHEYQIADSAAPIRATSGQIVGVVLVFSDVSERYRAAQALARTTELLERTGRLARVGGWEVNLQTMKLSWTLQTFQIAEIEPPVEPPLEEGINLFAPEARPTIAAAVQAAIDSGTPYDLELPLITAMGRRRWVRIQGQVEMHDGKSVRLYGTLQDITERKQAELALQAALKDKTALLKEVHHRVKNNLQVIASLLRLEAGRSIVPESVAVLRTMQGRVRSMAQLHESLYRSGTFASVDLGVYLGQIATQGFDSQMLSAKLLQLKLHMGSVQVGMDQAIACGLLVNELVSNCIKHGFPGDQSGEVCVELQPADPATVRTDALWRLRVRDTGAGLPPDFEVRREQSLGMTLAGDLSQQAGGTLEFQSEPGSGTEFSVVFRALAPAALVMPL